MIGFRFVLSPRRSSSHLITLFTLPLADCLLKWPGEDLHALAIADAHRVAHQWTWRRGPRHPSRRGGLPPPGPGEETTRPPPPSSPARPQRGGETKTRRITPTS